jgi:uncharacterized protein
MNKINDISHDYNHIKLVIKYSLKIAKKEGVNDINELFIIKMAALLHDIGDHKYTNKDQKKIINKLLNKFGKLRKDDKKEIIEIASNVSLSKEDNRKNKKLDIVKDADRINSLGAIGILRYATYNVKNSEKPSFNEIISNLTNRTEKIKMNIKTTTGKKIAKKQLKIISKFLKNYKKFI